MDALIGSTGYVGSTLSRQRPFDAQFHSSNAALLRGAEFDLVVCAAAPAQKWIANRDPAADERNIDALIANLREMRCRKFVLVSTVDVFVSPVGVMETSAVGEDDLHAYGRNRRRLEIAAASLFRDCLVVRLPALVGPGLRKNVIFDFLNDNNLAAIDSRGIFQFYPMVNLWTDLEVALRAGLELLHLTAEPVSVADVAREGFGRSFEQTGTGEPLRYDFRSVHAALFGGRGAYQYSRRESLIAIRAYAQTEPRTGAAR
jgi:dTDP-4-dehydrorhamnose reductase